MSKDWKDDELCRQQQRILELEAQLESARKSAGFWGRSAARLSMTKSRLATQANALRTGLQEAVTHLTTNGTQRQVRAGNALKTLLASAVEAERRAGLSEREGICLAGADEVLVLNGNADAESLMLQKEVFLRAARELIKTYAVEDYGDGTQGVVSSEAMVSFIKVVGSVSPVEFTVKPE